MVNPLQDIDIWTSLGKLLPGLSQKVDIAVYNFSDAHHGEKTVLPFTKDRQAIYQELCAYYGSRTSLRLRDLEEPRGTTSEATPDLLLITDMQIINLEEVVDFFTAAEGRNTVIHIGENCAIDRFRRVTQNYSNLRIFSVVERQDIPHIVLGQMRNYFVFTGD
ncbi:MAG: hypothetical protein O7G88_09280 [bacterium]|nr:hypothetical protein [bacterium]